MIRKKFSNFSFTKDDFKFSIKKLVKVAGHTEISIRKNKQILVFEYAIDADWIAESESDECEGMFSLTEINESDWDFHLPSITLSKKGQNGDKARGILKKCLKDEVIKLLSTFADEIREIDQKYREQK